MNEVAVGVSLIANANIEQVTQQLQAIENFQAIVNKTLKADQDYGVIPGTQKPTLLKPGAEKIIMLMGLESQYEVIEKVEDYQNGFFAYTVKSSLIKNGQLITEGFGSANTKENRYQLKEWDPEKGEKVWKGKYQDPYTLVNTVLKMAKKRAQVDATLTVGSLSNVFTQDMEDLKDFAKQEKMDNMTLEDAKRTKLTFGKFKGQTLGEIDDKSYLKWVMENARDDHMKQAAALVLNPPQEQQSGASQSLITQEQENEILNLVSLLGQVVDKGSDEVLEVYKVNDLSGFSETTANEFIETLANELSKHMPNTSNQEELFDSANPPIEPDDQQ